MPEPVEVRTGTLKVNSVPWSRVTLDGAAAGNTGGWTRSLSAGPHAVVFETEDGRTKDTTVEVPPDGTASFCWDFDLGRECLR